MATGIKETKDVVNLLGVLGEKIAGKPEIVKAFKERNYAALGQLFAGLALDAELRTAGTEAFSGIGAIKDEIKDLSVLEGIDIGADALAAVKRVYTAYNAAHNV